MGIKRFLHVIGLLTLLTTLLLTACGGGTTAPVPATNADPEQPVATSASDDPEAAPADGEASAPEPTPSPGNQFPDVLVLHPDATDLEINAAAGTYVYVVPGMVKEIMDYLLPALKDKGWEELGQPTLMGHLATINLQMDKSRLSVSLQDNERSQTTRVQMLLLQQ